MGPDPQRNISFLRLMLGLVVLGEMIYCLVFAPLQDFREVLIKEQVAVSRVFGDEDTAKIYGRADWMYSKLFIETGAAEKFVGKPPREEDSFSRYRMIARERAQVTLHYAYLIISRLAHFLTWLPLFVVLFIAAVHDGLCIREIKKTNFELASPVVARYAGRVSRIAFLLLFMGLMAPLGFTPLIIPACAIIWVIGMSVAVRNIQKRI